MSKPPEVKHIEMQAAWPPVTVEKHRERRSDHAVWAVAMALLALVVVLSQTPDFVGIIPAFIAGSGFQNWLSYPHLYGREEVNG